jgi:hypothetical protein
LLLYDQGTGLASQPATAGAAGRRLGNRAGNFLAQEVDALDSLLDAARQSARSAPTPGPRAPTDASGIGSLPVTWRIFLMRQPGAFIQHHLFKYCLSQPVCRIVFHCENKFLEP